MTRDTRRTRSVLAVLLVAAVTLVLLGGLSGGSLHGPGATVFGPIERAAAGIVRPVSHFVDRITHYGKQDAQIAALERQIAALQLENRTSTFDHNEAVELQKLLRVASVGQYRIVGARVIAEGPKQDFARTVTVDAGSRDGLKVGQTVVNGDGLVGTVTVVSASTATVQLIVDGTAGVGVRLAKTMVTGIVRGQGTDLLGLTIYNPQAQIAPGEQLVTGPFGVSSYAAGVPVGTLLTISAKPGLLNRTAVVRPYVDFETLDLVGIVVQGPRTDPRDAVLPAPPAPTPTVTVTVTAPPASPTPTGSGRGTSPSPGHS